MSKTTADGAVPRTRASRAGGLALGLAVACASAAATEKAQWLRSAEAANALSFACFGEENDADCQAMIRHYDAALAAPDADDGVRHELFKYRMNAVSARGGNLLDAGRTREALALLHEGHAQVVEHFDGGKHAHTVVENLRLQGHLLRALVETGDTAGAAAVAAAPRAIAPQFHERLDQHRDNERMQTLIGEAVIRSEEMETRYGDALAARAEALGAGAPEGQAARDAAIEAYRHAIVWLQRADAAGWTMPFEAGNGIRFAKLNNALGRVLLASGDRDGAIEAHHLAFAGARCRGFDDGTLDDMERAQAVRPCNAAVAGYMAASGETQRLATEMSEAMYRQQMELYRTDLGDLLKGSPPPAD